MLFRSLAAEIASRRRLGQRVVFTNGVFDILHTGHVTLLEEARRQGEFLVVGLNSDDSTRRLKPGRPINNQHDRARVLSSVGAVDAVVIFGEDTPRSLIETLRPDVLVKGSDYTKDKVVGAELVESWGGSVVLVDLVSGKSTTGLLRKMRAEGTP